MSISELFRATGSPAVQPVDRSSSRETPKIQGEKNSLGPSEFEKVLQSHHPATGEVKLSQHAETRIRSRDIPWNPDLERRISSGIDAAMAKGSREALILADNVAVIANVKSRTVVTAMDRTQMKDKIFTNIDSAVLV